MKISIGLEASETKRHITVDVKDLNTTIEEWKQLDYTKQYKIIEDYVFNLSEQPYWCIDSKTVYIKK